MKSYFPILILLILPLLVLTSCKEDDEQPEENTITITIEEPTPNETISDCTDVHIHVDVVASIENHEIEIILHPEGDVNNKIIDYDEHTHDMTITFEQSVDLCSFGAGSCFHLEVEACVDHDCTQKETADVEFCLQ